MRNAGKALVKAIALTSGQYLCTVDSDDKLHPETLSKTVNVLESDPDVGMVYTDHLIIDENGLKKGLGKRSLVPYSPERLLIDFMTFHFRLYRRSVYDAVGGFDASLSSAEDYDLCLRLSEVTGVRHLAEPLYYYRWHDQNISTTQQLTQTKCSAIAINNAIKRRGKTQLLRLEVMLNPSYKLQRRTKVANKVFGIGLSKTGTTSLNSALNLLGIPSIHCPRSLEQIKNFDAATDISIAVAYQKLDRLYPGSKFILTVRNQQDWLHSYQLHQQRILSQYKGRISNWMKELFEQCYGQVFFEPTVWTLAYERHLKSVLEYFQERSPDLLILDICGGEGWQELCTFLDCQVPAIAFPHQNQTQNSPPARCLIS